MRTYCQSVAATVVETSPDADFWPEPISDLLDSMLNECNRLVNDIRPSPLIMRMEFLGSWA
jgi:hypothetical protein